MSPAPLRRAAAGTAVAKDKAALEYERMVELYGRSVMRSRRRFIETTMQIQDKRTGLIVPWKLNWPQRAIDAIRCKTIRRGRPERYVILKARKWGISTLMLGYAIEEAERTPNFLGAIVADCDDSAAALLLQGKRIRSRQPFKLATKYDNRSQLYFDEPLNSQIDIESAANPDPLRGRTMRFVHNTEPQIWRDAIKKRMAIENAVPDQPGTFLAYEGTGYGRTWWYDFFFASLEGKNAYTAIFLPWLMDPTFDYAIDATAEEIRVLKGSMDFKEEELARLGATPQQLLWRRMKIANSFNGDEKLFAQEFPATPDEAFLADGRPVFSQDALLRAETSVEQPAGYDVIPGDSRGEGRFGVEYAIVKEPRGPLSVWREPQKNGEYVIGSDSGHGLRQDNSAAYVINARTREICASLVTNQVEPRPFGRMLCALGQHYNWAFILPEVEGPGAATLDSLKEENYPKILGREIYDQRQKLVGVKLGFSTNSQSRPRLFNEIREWLATNPDGVRDQELLYEMWSMYRDDSGKEKAASGKKDDRVIAVGVALMGCRSVIPEEAIDYVASEGQGSLERRHWIAFEMQCRRDARIARGDDPEPDDEEEYEEDYQ